MDGSALIDVRRQPSGRRLGLGDEVGRGDPDRAARAIPHGRAEERGREDDPEQVGMTLGRARHVRSQRQLIGVVDGEDLDVEGIPGTTRPGRVVLRARVGSIVGLAADEGEVHGHPVAAQHRAVDPGARRERRQTREERAEGPLEGRRGELRGRRSRFGRRGTSAQEQQHQREKREPRSTSHRASSVRRGARRRPSPPGSGPGPTSPTS